MDEKFKKSCPNCCQQFCLKSLTPQSNSNIPLFIKCGHSMCEKCLRNVVKCEQSIECKICQRKMEVTKTDIAMLIDNKIFFYDLFPVNTNMLGELALELIKEKAVAKEDNNEDYLRDLQAIITGTEQTKGQCPECHSETNKRCQQCATIICEDCFDKSHKSFVVFKNHILQDIEVQFMGNNCKIHSDKYLDYYCKDCKKPVCMDCFMVGSERSCKNHSVVPTFEMNETVMNDLREISPQVDVIYQRLTKTAIDLGRLLQTFDNDGGSSELKKIRATVEQHFSQLHAKIHAHKEEIFNIITKLKGIEKDSLVKAKDEIFETLKDAKRVRNSLKMAMDGNKNKSISETSADEAPLCNVSFMCVDNQDISHEKTFVRSDINLLSLLEDAKAVLTKPWHLSVEESNKDSLKVTVNDDLFFLISDYIHLDGNVRTLYKLRATHELNEVPALPPPGATVFSPLLIEDVKFNKSEASNERPDTPRKIALERIVNMHNSPPQDFDTTLDKSKTSFENFSMHLRATPRETLQDKNLNMSNSPALYPEKNCLSYDLEVKKFPSVYTKPVLEKKLAVSLREGLTELVTITHIIDPDNFFVLRAFDEKVLNKLMVNPEQNFTEITNKISTGDSLIVNYENSWMRCRVESIDESTYNTLYQVFCVDFGFTISVTIDRLRSLPTTSTLGSSLSRTRDFAIKCRLANCKPKNGTWTSQDTDLVKTIIENGQVTIHVRRVGETSECDVITQDGVSLAHALVFHGRAVLENQFLRYRDITDSAEKPKLFMSNNNLKLKVTENVFITHVENPDNFFVRPSYLQKDFYGLCEDLNQEYDLGDTFGIIYLPERDMLCVVHIDKELELPYSGWKRAIVTSFEDGLVTVFLPDIGDTVEVNWNRLRRIKKKFTVLRGLACECFLVGIAPLDTEWPQEATAFMNIFKECQLKLYVDKKQKRPSVGAILLSESEEKTICINQELINNGLVADTGNFDFDLLKPKTALSKPIEKTPEPTANIAKALSPKKQQPIVKERDHHGPLRLEAKILRYESPSLMYISLVQQQKSFNKMFEDLQKFYAKRLTLRRGNWKVNDRCCVLCIQSETWRRATITAVGKDQVSVFYVDFACTETVPISHLKKLHPDFEKMGDGTIKCHLGGVLPAAGNGWPTVTNEFLKEKLDSYSRVFMTKVGEFKDKSMPVELWVYHTIQGSALEPDESDWRSLSQEIIKQGLGIPDKKYQAENVVSSANDGEDETLSFLNLTGTVNDWLQLPPMQFTPPSSSDSDTSSPMKMGFDSANDNTLFISDWLPAEPLSSPQFTGVPTYIDNDGIIYLYDVTQREVLDLIRDSLEMAYKADDPKSQFCTWRVGEPCIARYYLDSNFYRGKVLEVNKEESTCLILYVDYGNHEVCSFSNLRKGIALHQFPVQAHKCSLSRVQPKGKKWDLNILDYIHKTIVEKKCFVKVAGDPIDDITPVDLKYDKLWINDHLVEFDMAKYTDGSKPLLLKYSPDKKGKGKGKTFKEKEIEQAIKVDCEGEPDYIVEQDNSSDDYKLLESWKTNAKMDSNLVIYPNNEKTEFDCTVALISGPNYLELNIVQNTETNDLYEKLFETIEKEGKDMPLLDGIFENKACIALFPQDNKWYRASILKYSESKNLIKVRYVDYGNIEIISMSDIREIRREWATLPPASISVQLHRVKVNPGFNPDDVTSAYAEVFLDKDPFHAKIMDYKETVPCVELRNEHGLVYQKLIEDDVLLHEDDVITTS